MTKDEALKLALAALECKDGWGSSIRSQKERAITAIKQARSAPVHDVSLIDEGKTAPVQEPVAWMDIDEKGSMSGLRYWTEPDNRHEVALYTTPPVQPALVEPDWKAEYLKSVESGCITLDELREANAELDATNRQVEILSDALAESRREVAAIKQALAAPVQPVAHRDGFWCADLTCKKCYSADFRFKHTTPPAQPAPVPKGWKMVPVEPTREMWTAVNKLDDQCAAGSYDGKGCSIEQAWNCLLDAAPTPPAAQPAVPDAMTSADIQEHIEYVAGWNDCRQAMLEMMK
jgi:hypothetical protein